MYESCIPYSANAEPVPICGVSGCMNHVYHTVLMLSLFPSVQWCVRMYESCIPYSANAEPVPICGVSGCMNHVYHTLLMLSVFLSVVFQDV